MNPQNVSTLKDAGSGNDLESFFQSPYILDATTSGLRMTY